MSSEGRGARPTGMATPVRAALLIVTLGCFSGGVAHGAPEVAAKPPEGSSQGYDRKISDERAREIALKAVPGEVTDLDIERKLGGQRIVVEVLAKDGTETDVIIDMQTGEVLGTEE